MAAIASGAVHVGTKVADFDLFERILRVSRGEYPSGELLRWAWSHRRNRVWIVLGMIAAIVAVLAVTALTGVLGGAYEAFYTATLGYPYTWWFRDNPWFFFPAVLAVDGALFTLVKKDHWITLVVSTVWFAMGFLAGHVIW